MDDETFLSFLPQTVHVDRNGNADHLHVGGGRKVISGENRQLDSDGKDGKGSKRRKPKKAKKVREGNEGKSEVINGGKESHRRERSANGESVREGSGLRRDGEEEKEEEADEEEGEDDDEEAEEAEEEEEEEEEGAGEELNRTWNSKGKQVLRSQSESINGTYGNRGDEERAQPQRHQAQSQFSSLGLEQAHRFFSLSLSFDSEPKKPTSAAPSSNPPSTSAPAPSSSSSSSSSSLSSSSSFWPFGLGSGGWGSSRAKAEEVSTRSQSTPIPLVESNRSSTPIDVSHPRASSPSSPMSPTSPTLPAMASSPTSHQNGPRPLSYSAYYPLNSPPKGPIVSPPSRYKSPLTSPPMSMRAKSRSVSSPPTPATPLAEDADLQETLALLPRFRMPFDVSHYSTGERLSMALQLFRGLPTHYISHGREYLTLLLSRDFLTNLPAEVAMHILSFTNEATIANCSLVCKSWYKVCQDNILWKTFFFRCGLRLQLPEYEFTISWKEQMRLLSKVKENWRKGRYEKSTLAAHNEFVYSLHYDSRTIISGSRDNTIKVWSLPGGQCRATLQGHTGSVLTLQFDATKVISGSSDSTIKIWDLQTCQLITTLTEHTQSVLGVRFRDNTLVSCSKDKTIRIWDLKDFTQVRVLVDHSAAVNAIHLHENQVVSASGDRTIKIWDIATGECLRTIEGHERGVACLQYDGHTIVSGSSDNSIRVWDAKTGSCVRVLLGHRDLVRTLQFDRDFIVSGSYDESIFIWDFKTGALLHELKGHGSRIFKIQFSESKIISCSQDQTIVIWDFSGGIKSDFFY